MSPAVGLVAPTLIQPLHLAAARCELDSGAVGSCSFLLICLFAWLNRSVACFIEAFYCQRSEGKRSVACTALSLANNSSPSLM